VARVVVDVMLKPEILDPQGQAVANALPRLGVSDVASVRIGRRIEIEFEGEPDLNRANEIAGRLLANPVIEDYSIRVETAAPGLAAVETAAPGLAAVETAAAGTAADVTAADEADAASGGPTAEPSQ
jgi:phosphoribosylformylglycinamidine synthase